MKTRLSMKAPPAKNRYTECKALGEGTTAEVFSALDSFTGRRVVLKVARNEEMAALFLQEVQLMRHLVSPVFPRMLDFLPARNGIGTIVMEHRGGEPLEDLLTETFSDQRVLSIWIQLSQGLCELVEAGRIHGDLSPGNVLLDQHQASLLDLGLARELDQETVDRSGTIISMPPERLAEGRLHRNSDVFSLGVLIWSLICGESPWPEESSACMEAILEGRVNPPPEHAANPLMPLVLRCLLKNPNQRPSPGELLQELLGLDASEFHRLVPTVLREPTSPEWLEKLKTELQAGHSGLLFGPAGGGKSLHLDRLLGDLRLADHALMRISCDTADLLAWARQTLLRHPGLADYDFLNTGISRWRQLPQDQARLRRWLNELLDFLPGFLGQHMWGLSLDLQNEQIVNDGLPNWFSELARLCHERNLQLLCVTIQNPETDIADFLVEVPLPTKSSFRQSVAGAVPGLQFSEELLDQVDRLSQGRLDYSLDVIRSNMLQGNLRIEDSVLGLCGRELLRPRGSGLKSLNELEPNNRELLAEIIAWSPLAGQALWLQRLHDLGARDLLSRLQADALLRDRGDGVPTASGGLAELLEGDLSRRAHTRLFQWFDRRPESPVALLLGHLASSDPAQIPRERSLSLLRQGVNSGFPEDRSRLIEVLLENHQGIKAESISDLYTTLVQAYLEQARPADAMATIRRLFRVEKVDQDIRNNAALQLGHIYLGQGKPRLARRVFQGILKYSSTKDKELKLQTLTQLIRVHATMARREQALQLLSESESLLQSFEKPWNHLLSYQVNVLAAMAFHLNQEKKAEAWWIRLLNEEDSLPDPSSQPLIRMNLAVVYMNRNELDLAEEQLEIASGEANTLHLEDTLAQLQINLGYTNFLRARLKKSESQLALARKLCEATGNRALLLNVLYAHADGLYREGRLQEALNSLDLLRDTSCELQAPHSELESAHARKLIEWDMEQYPDRDTFDLHLNKILKLDNTEMAREWRCLGLATGLLTKNDFQDDSQAKCDAILQSLLNLSPKATTFCEPRELDFLATLPESEWPLRQRLELCLCTLLRPEAMLERFRSQFPKAGLSPLQEVCASMRIGRSWLKLGETAKAGEQLGRAVKLLRQTADTLEDGPRKVLGSAPMTVSLGELARECQTRLREKRT